MARSFDGSNDGLSALAPVVSTVLSIAGRFWVNTGAVTGVLASMGTAGSANNRRDIIYQSSDTTFRARSFNNAGTGVNAVISATGFFDQWVLIAGVWNGVADRTVYRGTSSANNTTSNSPNAPNEMLVGISHTGTSPLAGRAAEVGVWDVALSAADIAMLTAGLSPLAVQPANLIGYWPLVGRTSPEINLVGVQVLTMVDAPDTIEHPLIYMPSSRFSFDPRRRMALSRF